MTFTLKRFLAVVIIVSVLAVTVRRGDEPRKLSICAGNLKAWTRGVLCYQTQFKRFARPTTPNGFCSWRVAVMPFLNLGTLPIDQGSPWNSRSNRQFHIPGAQGLQCSEREDATSPYVQIIAVTAANSIWQDKVVSLGDIMDKKSQTLVLMELDLEKVHWMSPKNVTLDELIAMLERDGRVPSAHPGGVLMSFADGSVRFVPHERISPEILRAIVSIDGGEDIPDDFGMILK